MRSIPVAVASLFVLAASQAHAGPGAVLTRGPYLQSGSPTSIVVRWRTDINDDSQVNYGAAPGSLTSMTSDAALTTEHIITLSLSADTLYYYSVGNTGGSVLAGDDANHFFRTAPATGVDKPTRLWIIGDAGTSSWILGDTRQATVRDAAQALFDATQQPDLFLMLGDNAYFVGNDAEYQTAVFDMYSSTLRNKVLWPTYGNHEAFSANSLAETGPYYDMFTLPDMAQAGGVASMGEAYYSFDYGNIHFISLESNETNATFRSTMETWLDTDLAATAADWIIVFFHHPPYTKGSHNSDIEPQLIYMRETILPILESYGVDLVLTGHSHCYERSFLIDGYYSTPTLIGDGVLKNGGDGRPAGDGAYTKPGFGATSWPNEGAVYAVAGSSGQATGGTLNHPVMYLSMNVLGSLVVDINDNTDQLDAQFVQPIFTPSQTPVYTISDSFSIQKGTPTPTPTLGPGSCPPIPNPACRTPGKSKLTLKDDTDDSKDKLAWKWLKGAATDIGALGDPTTSTYYRLCIYDASSLVLNAQAPAGGTCAGDNCWAALGTTGFKYKDKDLDPDGLQKLIVKSGAAGKAKVLAKGRGINLPMPALPLTTPVTVQLHNSANECWQAQYTSASTATGEQFKAEQ